MKVPFEINPLIYFLPRELFSLARLTTCANILHQNVRSSNAKPKQINFLNCSWTATKRPNKYHRSPTIKTPWQWSLSSSRSRSRKVATCHRNPVTLHLACRVADLSGRERERSGPRSEKISAPYVIPVIRFRSRKNGRLPSPPGEHRKFACDTCFSHFNRRGWFSHSALGLGELLPFRKYAPVKSRSNGALWASVCGTVDDLSPFNEFISSDYWLPRRPRAILATVSLASKVPLHALFPKLSLSCCICTVLLATKLTSFK